MRNAICFMIIWFSIKKLNQKKEDIAPNFLACMVTTNAKKATWPYTIALNLGEGGIKKQSYILSFKTIEISENELEKYVGGIKNE